MAIAFGLLLLLLFTVIFHFASPWWFTPLASNWGAMDDTIVLTFWVTGLVFIAITVFLIYCIVRYRHKEGRKAAFEPEHKALEIWLMVLTSVGVVILLAPGLKIWGDYVNVPEDAHVVEAVAQQWQWSYRYPGADGKLGSAHNKHVSFNNPAGVNPDDPHGQDDIVITGGDMHLPVDKPVKVLLRSKDVLHDFYVPQFRAKMDVVPGLVSYLWFTPTKVGTFEVICAELCGMGHYNMRSHVIVDSAEAHTIWLAEQATFGQTMQAVDNTDPLLAKGREVAQGNGCLGCHSLDGSSMLGPSWKGMVGSTETLADGSTVLVDEAYLIESIVDPNAKIVQGYSAAVMPPANLSENDMQALLHFMATGSADTAVDGADSAVDGANSPDDGIDVNNAIDNTVDDQASNAEDSDAIAVDAKTANAVATGAKLSQQYGCVACHSIDGSKSLGPSWKGLVGSERQLANGETVLADAQYIERSIIEPNAQIVEGYPAIMQPASLNRKELNAMQVYLESL
jgi:cytochrome c oxidase subunit 2